MFSVIVTSISIARLSANFSNIPPLNDTKFNVWKDNVAIFIWVVWIWTLPLGNHDQLS